MAQETKKHHASPQHVSIAAKKPVASVVLNGSRAAAAVFFGGGSLVHHRDMEKEICEKDGRKKVSAIYYLLLLDPRPAPPAIPVALRGHTWFSGLGGDVVSIKKQVTYPIYILISLWIILL